MICVGKERSVVLEVIHTTDKFMLEMCCLFSYNGFLSCEKFKKFNSLPHKRSWCNLNFGTNDFFQLAGNLREN